MDCEDRTILLIQRPTTKEDIYRDFLEEDCWQVSERPKLLRVLAGEALTPPPIWIMRQAGRYLPEYRKTRKKAGSFLELCFTPELAADVTLQPVKRFDFDAAILFSDILVIPHVLGQSVRFEEGQGPILSKLESFEALDLSGLEVKLAPVLETVRSVRRELAAEKALIGFCGGPWTVATYMIAGRATADHLAARRLALEEPERLQWLIDILVAASVRYLVAQIRAGVDVVKVFDRWAGVLDEAGFERWVVRPMRMIVEQVRAVAPKTPIIGFPRGAGVWIGDYARKAGVDAVAVDWTTPMHLARELVPEPVALQGNLDPLRVVVGGEALDEGVDRVLAAMKGRAHIFNLGHGITPDAPVANVARLVERVRGACA
jgi:uroporphyrinogen decarboxylase